VTATVQQHHLTCPGALQVLDHAVTVNTVTIGVIIAVSLKLKAHASQQGDMYRPGGITHPYSCSWCRGLDDFSADTQGATATRCLYASHTPRLQGDTILTQDQLLHSSIKGGITGRWDVGFSDLLAHQAMLGLFHRFKYRANALLIHIDTDGQVNLVRVSIRTAGGRQTKNGVVR